LEELDSLRSFALVGPGFTGGGFSLISNLRDAGETGRVVYLPYEREGRAFESFDGDERAVEIEWGDPEPLHVSLDSAGHAEGVRSIRDSIAAGDVYQVNLTLRARIAEATAPQVFRALCRRGVPRFAAWVRLPDGSEFVSASPELFFEVERHRVRCEPMKGTAPPEALSSLQSSEKDSAELAMITDLIRNDLTPLCVPRSVRVVNERRFIELPYAIQTVSDIEGVLLPNSALREILTSLHPGGSITGAPKRAACEIISRLEPTPRGAYCGTLGYHSGERSTFSLLIRTAEKVEAGWVYGVGGGIVWDSVAAKELEEVHVKLGALR
jgi:anthranilate/para-aminobenzoate synthase component I